MCSSFAELWRVGRWCMPEPGDFSDQLAWNVYKREDAQLSCEEMSVAFRPCPILGFKKCIRGWWSGLGEKKKQRKRRLR